MVATTSPARVPIAQLELAVLRRVDGLLQGDHAGLLPGHGSEPGEARVYAPGDDPRRMDWAVTARTGEPHVRDTIADHELELWVVLDTSASLAFGTARSEKRDVAWAAAGALALLAARGGNRVGMVTAGGRRVEIPARSGRNHVAASLTALRDREPLPLPSGAEHRAGRAARQARVAPDLSGALERVRRTSTRRGMVVVVSDFLGNAGWERPLRALAARHHVLALEVVDPRELSLPDVGWLELVDAESGRRRSVDTHDAELRARYAAAAREQRATTARAIATAGAEHCVLRTDRDWVVDLVRFVSGRKARLAAAGRSR